MSGGPPSLETPAVELRQAYRITTIIAGAMLASLAFYVLVVEIIKTNRLAPAGFAAGDPSVLRYLFFAIGLALLVMSRVVRARVLAGSPGLEARRLQTATIVSLATCEAIALLGLVLFVLTGSARDFYLFLALAGLGFLLNFPRWSHWAEAARPSPARS